MVRISNRVARQVPFFAALLGTLGFSALAQAQQPQPGDVQTVQVITLAMHVGSTEKETRQVTYAPPPGWYIRSHAVQCTTRSGNSSFSVGTVPRDWDWLSEDKVKESYRALLDLAGKAADHGVQAKIIQERDAWLRQLHHVRSTHHALIVDATARGEGFLRNGGVIELTVTAELVYVGTEDDLQRLALRLSEMCERPR